MPASHGSKIRDKAMLHEQDCKVGLDQNIPPFGACHSEENNEIKIEINDAKDLMPMGDENGNPIEATLPIQGKLCVPKLGDKWLNAQVETLVDGKPAITVQCTIACAYPIQRITGLSMKQALNEHARLPLEGILWENEGMDWMERAAVRIRSQFMWKVRKAGSCFFPAS